MLPEISLNILDISQNSISAKATQIKIMVWVNTFKQQIKVQIKDNGTGMDAETVKRVTDPFYIQGLPGKSDSEFRFLNRKQNVPAAHFPYHPCWVKGRIFRRYFVPIILTVCRLEILMRPFIH